MAKQLCTFCKEKKEGEVTNTQTPQGDPMKIWECGTCHVVMDITPKEEAPSEAAGA